MNPATFAPGFHVSLLDGAILILGVVVAIVCPSDLAIIGGMAVGHFFLFCNVFRIRRKPELIWASTFVVLATGTLTLRVPGWPVTIGLLLGWAAILIALEMRDPSYHGIGWRLVNPKLPAWWRARQELSAPAKPAGQDR